MILDHKVRWLVPIKGTGEAGPSAGRLGGMKATVAGGGMIGLLGRLRNETRLFEAMAVLMLVPVQRAVLVVVLLVVHSGFDQFETCQGRIARVGKGELVAVTRGSGGGADIFLISLDRAVLAKVGAAALFLSSRT